MTKYLIIDDEHIAHDIIKGYCDLVPDMKLEKSCYDAIEAIDYLRNNPVDLIFLDLNMPKLKGFDFLRTLRSAPKVIVTTAYSEFALEGYELNVVDYLLKPFSFERFMKSINKALDVNNSQERNFSLSSDKDNTIFLRSDKKHTQVAIDSILFLESSGNYVKVITNSEEIVVRNKLSDLLHSLPENEFIQVHKSFAVAKKHIHSIDGNRIFIDAHQIPVGKTYKLNIDRIIG